MSAQGFHGRRRAGARTPPLRLRLSFHQEGCAMRLRRITAGLVLGALLAAGGATAAFATAPVDTGGSSVVDQVNALSSSDASAVQDAVDQVSTDTGTQLTVVYVDTFSDPADERQWAIDAAERSGLGSGAL